MWKPIKKAKPRPAKMLWTWASFPWTIACQKHEDYKIADTYGHHKEFFRIRRRVSRPANDCDLCWRLYYNWFGTKHWIQDTAKEVAECEAYRASRFKLSKRRRAEASRQGLGEREKSLLRCLGLSEAFIAEYSNRALLPDAQSPDWVSRAVESGNRLSGNVRPAKGRIGAPAVGEGPPD